MTEYTITVNTKPFGDDLKLYQRTKFTFVPGLNSLVGCNGSGKTTLIDQYLIPSLRKDNVEYYKYNDRREGGSMLMDRMLNVEDDARGLVRMYISSEGERIVVGLERVVMALPSFFKENKDKPAFLILDAIDSGMSVDEICEIKELMLDVVIPDAKSRFNVDLFVVIAANNYEWCNDDRINNIDITKAKSIKFKGYEDYVQHIKASRTNKDKMRE